MPRVQGIGGIFFKSADPKALYEWYEKHLGIAAKPGEGAMLPPANPFTVWSIFPDSTKYFRASKAPFMINYIVDDLDALLAELKTAGVEVDENVERHDYGNFGWISDPDGNRIELWEPKGGSDPPTS